MSANDVEAFAFDPVALRRLAPDLREKYLRARPWPHAVIHGLIPVSLIAAAAGECTEVGDRLLMTTAGRNQVKQEAAEGLGPVTTRLLAELEGEAFREFLETVTGVPGLQPDPSRALAGMHRTPVGGFTLVHRDFRRHPTTNLHHRVNVLLYLNQEWQDDWGGFLELWPSDMKQVGRRIPPQGNTIVLWETHDQTLHGLPDPVACPPTMSRLSLASYWYSASSREASVKLRRPVFARRPQDDWRIGRRPAREFIRDLVAPRRSYF